MEYIRRYFAALRPFESPARSLLAPSQDFVDLNSRDFIKLMMDYGRVPTFATKHVRHFLMAVRRWIRSIGTKYQREDFAKIQHFIAAH
jgi:hypothetical protein